MTAHPTHPTKPTQEEKVKKLEALIADIKVAMFTTIDDPSGRLHARPMHVQGGLDAGHLYFFTYADSAKVKDFRHDQQVNCAFAKPGDSQFVSISGRARLTQDFALMKEKWAAPLVAWFPDGLETDGIALIDVHVDDAQYWDSRNQLMVHAFGMVKAILTGESVKDAGDNEKLTL